MIVLDHVTKTEVLQDVSLVLPTDRKVVVLGHQGAGKTTLVQLLSGLALPTSGTIRRYARVSFPIGFSGGFRTKLSVRANLAHVAKIYGANVDEVVRFVDGVLTLGAALEQPYGLLPRWVRNSFNYAVGYAIPFDLYLIDGRVSIGDPVFREKCLAMFEARARTSGFIMTASNPKVAKKFADLGAIIHDGGIRLFDDLDEAIETFDKIELPKRSGGTPVAYTSDLDDDE